MGISSSRPRAAGAQAVRVPVTVIHDPLCTRLLRLPRDVSCVRLRQRLHAAVRPTAGGRMPGPPAGPTRGGLT